MVKVDLVRGIGMGERKYTTLQLVCDRINCTSASTFRSKDYNSARKDAIVSGWKFKSNKRGKGGGKYMICPICIEIEHKFWDRPKSGRKMRYLNTKTIED